MAAVLLGLRFVLELCLLGAAVVVGAAWGGGSVPGAVTGVGLALCVALLWGLLLAPRRRIDLPLAVRVVLELGLFVLVGAGLAAAGYGRAAVALVAAELVLLPMLALLGRPPGWSPESARGSPDGARARRPDSRRIG